MRKTDVADVSALLPPHLLVTACRSFISDLSNQMWGQDLTMDLWMTPISPL